MLYPLQWTLSGGYEVDGLRRIDARRRVHARVPVFMRVQQEFLTKEIRDGGTVVAAPRTVDVSLELKLLDEPR